MILSKKLSIKFTFILLFMVGTNALSEKFFDLYPRIPERLELFPGLLSAPPYRGVGDFNKREMKVTLI